MRRPEDLTTRELRQIAELAQRWLFLEGQSRQGSGGTGPDVWNIDKDVDANDFALDMGEMLGDLGMAPPTDEELGQSRKKEEFAEFVDDTKGANDLQPRPLLTDPHPLAAEHIRIGDMVVLVDGKVRLHDRGEAVKRLLAEYALWSGGFKPAETSHEERKMFLSGRALDDALEAAMWPERQQKAGAD